MALGTRAEALSAGGDGGLASPPGIGMGIGVGAGIGMGLNAIGVNEIGVKLEGNVTGTEEGMGVNWGGVDGGGGRRRGRWGEALPPPEERLR